MWLQRSFDWLLGVAMCSFKDVLTCSNGLTMWLKRYFDWLLGCCYVVTKEF